MPKMVNRCHDCIYFLQDLLEDSVQGRCYGLPPTVFWDEEQRRPIVEATDHCALHKHYESDLEHC